MSIFVDAGKRFELAINCDVIKHDNGEVLCYKIHPNGKAQVICDVKGRNFSDMSNIIEEATIITSKYRSGDMRGSESLAIVKMPIECIIDKNNTPEYYKSK
mgnify:CR=1 FL=1